MTPAGISVRVLVVAASGDWIYSEMPVSEVRAAITKAVGRRPAEHILTSQLSVLAGRSGPPNLFIGDIAGMFGAHDLRANGSLVIAGGVVMPKGRLRGPRIRSVSRAHAQRITQAIELTKQSMRATAPESPPNWR